MKVVNAIAKVRFASVGAQRIRLCKDGLARTELLCLEPGQELKVSGGQWVYYVVKGQARAVTAGGAEDFSAGEIAASELSQPHSIVNVGEQRLICVSFGLDQD